MGAHATYSVVLAGTIALGCLAYALIERPTISWLQRRHKNWLRAAGPVIEGAPSSAGSIAVRNTPS